MRLARRLKKPSINWRFPFDSLAWIVFGFYSLSQRCANTNKCDKSCFYFLPSKSWSELKTQHIIISTRNEIRKLCSVKSTNYLIHLIWLNPKWFHHNCQLCIWRCIFQNTLLILITVDIWIWKVINYNLPMCYALQNLKRFWMQINCHVIEFLFKMQ